MKQIFCFLTMIWLCTSCTVTRLPQFKGKYNSFLESDETEVVTYYHNMVSQKKDGSHIYRQFFPETRQMTLYFQYEKSTQRKNGPYREWYDDGTLAAEGQYVNNQKTGVWKLRYGSTGIYKEDQKEGEWQMKDKNGNLSAIYQYKSGKRDGAFIIYDTLGVVTNKGIYQADTVFFQTSAVKEFSESEIMPMLATCMDIDLLKRKQCSEKTMLEYVYKNMRYPYDAREYGVQGQVVAQFVVDKEGNIVDITILKGLCQSISNEVKRIIKMLPKWNPGMQDGKPVKVLYTLPVKFKLE